MFDDEISYPVDGDEFVDWLLDEYSTMDFGDDLPDGRERPSLYEQMEEHRSRPRDERILDKVAPQDHLGDWDPAEDEQLHRFIALREAGLSLGIDIISHFDVWFILTDRIECRSLGYKLTLTSGDLLDGPRHDFDELVTLNRMRDWDRLKELAEFDPEEWPMDEIEGLVEGVYDDYV